MKKFSPMNVDKCEFDQRVIAAKRLDYLNAESFLDTTGRFDAIIRSGFAAYAKQARVYYADLPTWEELFIRYQGVET